MPISFLHYYYLLVQLFINSKLLPHAIAAKIKLLGQIIKTKVTPFFAGMSLQKLFMEAANYPLSNMLCKVSVKYLIFV